MYFHVFFHNVMSFFGFLYSRETILMDRDDSLMNRIESAVFLKQKLGKSS